MLPVNGKYTTARIMIDDVEKEAMAQIIAFINNESFTNPVVIMPDVHAGTGAVIGFTMELGDRVIPNVVGVDECCGMFYVRLSAGALFNILFDELDEKVRAAIPMGMNVHKTAILDMEKDFPWAELQKTAVEFTQKYNERYGTSYKTPVMDYRWFLDLCKRIDIDVNYAIKSLGTLGGGNHFIEIGRDDFGQVGVTVHSGSRNLGARMCNHWQRIAVHRRHERLGLIIDKDAEIAKIKAKYPKKEWNKRIKALAAHQKKVLASDDLEYLEGDDMFGYLLDSVFALVYADTSRRLMADIVINLLAETDRFEEISTVHNYISPKDFIIRKGAIASYTDRRMIIPFNMEEGLLIVDGRSNPDWNYSAPHGAGRRWSRRDAKKLLNQEQAEADLREAGVYASAVPLDEAKDAYKDSRAIEEAIGPTAHIIRRVVPLLNFKARK